MRIRNCFIIHSVFKLTFSFNLPLEYVKKQGVCVGGGRMEVGWIIGLIGGQKEWFAQNSKQAKLHFAILK